MAIEYERWLIARSNVFSPSADAIVKLVEKLRAEKWIIDPASPDMQKLQFRGPRAKQAQTTGGYALKRIENTFGDDALAKIAASTESLPATLDGAWLSHPTRSDLNLVWTVSSEASPLRYPLTRKPDGPTSYQLEIHRAYDFVYPISDTIDALPTECRCGNELAFEWDDDDVINPFGATTGISTECDECSRTFDPSKVTATIKNPFDGSEEEVPGGCAYRFAIKVDCKKHVVDDPRLAFAPDLVALVEKEFGRSFYEVGSIY